MAPNERRCEALGIHTMQTRIILRRATITVVLLAFGFLWLRELTMRRARETANDFIGPLIREVPCQYVFFSSTGFPTPERRRMVPGWIVNFHPYGIELDPGVEVYVSICGNVIACNLPELNALVGASAEAREKQINLLMESMRLRNKGQ